MARAITVLIPKARRILDLGCGTGWFLAEARTDGCPFLVGVDYSWQSLNGLNGVPTREVSRAKPISLVLGDGLHLPFADRSFEVVIGHVSMPYMNTGSAFREIHRVLAPGGSFLVTVHSFYFVRQWLLQDLRRGHWKGLPYKVYIAANGVLNHLTLPQMQVWWNKKMFETVNTRRGIRRSAEKAGFLNVSSHPQPDRIFFDVTGQKSNEGGPTIPPPEAIYPAL